MLNFDKEIKNRGENFSLQPRPEVWKRVESELDKQKRGRIIGWWWLTPVVIIAWGFAFSFLNGNVKKAFYNQDSTNHPASVNPVVKSKTRPAKNGSSSPAEQAVTTKQQATESIKEEKNISRPAGQATGKRSSTNNPHSKTIAAKQEPSHYHENKTSARAYESSNDKKVAASGNTGKSQSGDPGPVLNATATVKQEPNAAPNQSHPSIDNIDSHTSKTLPVIENSKETAELNKSSTSTGNQPVQPEAASHSNVNKNVAIGKPASSKIKKANWRIGLSAGASINEESVFKHHPKDTTNGSGGSSGGGGMIPEMEKNTKGFTIAGSVERVFSISKRWQWKPGLFIQYQETKQSTGILEPYPVDPSPPDWNYSASFYFEPGKDLSHTGNNLRLALSSDFSFGLFKKPSLFINAGVYGGWNAYDHYLLPDELQVWWIPSAKYYNTFFAGARAGIEYRLPKGFGIGITGMHDFTQSYQKLRDKEYFWQSALVQFTAPLNFK